MLRTLLLASLCCVMGQSPSAHAAVPRFTAERHDRLNFLLLLSDVQTFRALSRLAESEVSTLVEQTARPRETQIGTQWRQWEFTDEATQQFARLDHQMTSSLRKLPSIRQKS